MQCGGRQSVSYSSTNYEKKSLGQSQPYKWETNSTTQMGENLSIIYCVRPAWEWPTSAVSPSHLGNLYQTSVISWVSTGGIRQRCLPHILPQWWRHKVYTSLKYQPSLARVVWLHNSDRHCYTPWCSPKEQAKDIGENLSQYKRNYCSTLRWLSNTNLIRHTNKEKDRHAMLSRTFSADKQRHENHEYHFVWHVTDNHIGRNNTFKTPHNKNQKFTNNFHCAT